MAEMNADTIQLRRMSGPARLFVGLVTTLMLLVVLWAAWLYTVEKGKVDPTALPDYLSEQQRQALQKNTGNRPTADTRQAAAPDLRKNLGLAHVHINGQTLLFFALGAIFLFTSVPARRKKAVFLTFAGAVLVHAVGLSGEGYHWFFDDILALSGVVMLLTMLYMALQIYVDLGRASAKDRTS